MGNVIQAVEVPISDNTLSERTGVLMPSHQDKRFGLLTCIKTHPACTFALSKVDGHSGEKTDGGIA